MESIVYWFIILFGVFTIYRMLSRRSATPKARVTAMLRQYQDLAKTGLSETECMFRLLTMRPGWKNLPHGFLSEIVGRLRTKEDVMRFVSLAEDYRELREKLPAIASKAGINEGVVEVACLLARRGYPLQQQGRLKEAEFVQRIALALGPDCHFTTLPLAATYYEAGKYGEAKPLFELGLAQFDQSSPPGASQPLTMTACLGSDIDVEKLRETYLDMYDACLKNRDSK